MDNICAVCKKISQQLLILSCQHDPCIKCVAKQYFHEANVQNDFQLTHKHSFYTCNICYELTKLDESTILELKKFRKNYHKKNHPSSGNNHYSRKSEKRTSSSKNTNSASQPKTPRQASTNSSHHSNQNLLKLQQLRESKFLDFFDQPSERQDNFSFNQYPPKPPKQYLAYCQKHEGEEKTFYCFNCFTDICAECAIHGSHFGHEVQAIKKAANRLKKAYGEILAEAQRYDSILCLQYRQLNKMVEKFKEWNAKQRKNIKSVFHDLYQMLRQKQKKLEREVDEVQKEGLNQIQHNKAQYEKIINELKGKRRIFMNAFNVEPGNWNIETLEKEKENINYIVNERIKSLITHKQKNEIKYLTADLISEAVETIQQFVGAFKLTLSKQ